MLRRLCSALTPLSVAAGVLLVSPAAFAQAPGIAFYEFSSCALDFAPSGTPPLSLQATLGQTLVTVDPPTPPGQTRAALGFWETGVPFLYQTQVDLEGFVGRTAAPLRSLPFTFQLLDASGTLIDQIEAFPASTNAQNSANFAVSSWANPAFVASLTAKGDRWLRQKKASTLSAAGSPGAAFALLAGDANNNNVVDVDDLTLLLNLYNTAAGDGLYLAAADFTGNGTVDVDDLTLLLHNYNTNGN